jgi:hypothetical protein
MKSRTLNPDKSPGIWQRVLRLEGELSSGAARALLKLGFAERDQCRMRDLSAKARAATLTSQEQIELNTFEGLGCLLDIVHSQARRALNKKPKRAS